MDFLKYFIEVNAHYLVSGYVDYNSGCRGRSITCDPSFIPNQDLRISWSEIDKTKEMKGAYDALK